VSPSETAGAKPVISTAATAVVTRRDALIAAALALVCYAVAQSGSHAGPVVFGELLIDRHLTFVADIGYPLAFLTGIAALLLLARGSYLLGAGLLASAFGLRQWAQGLLNLRFHPVYQDFWQLPLALTLILPLIWRRPAVPNQSWRWLLGIPIAVVVLPTQFNEALLVKPFGLWAFGIVALLMSIVDPGVGIAAAALLLAPILSLLGFYYLPGEMSDPSIAFMLLAHSTLAVPLIVVGAVLIPRMRLQRSIAEHDPSARPDHVHCHAAVPRSGTRHGVVNEPPVEDPHGYAWKFF
jgi:hypothetical protein